MQGGMGTGAKIAAGFKADNVIDRTAERRRDMPGA